MDFGVLSLLCEMTHDFLSFQNRTSNLIYSGLNDEKSLAGKTEEENKSSRNFSYFKKKYQMKYAVSNE